MVSHHLKPRRGAPVPLNLNPLGAPPGAMDVAGVQGVYARVNALAGAINLITGLFRRVVYGPPLAFVEYTLHAPGGTPHTLAELLERLAARGYQLDVAALDDKGKPSSETPLPTSKPLSALQICIQEKRARKDGEVILRLNLREDGSLFGLLSMADSARGICSELAQFLMVELGALVTGLEFERMGSKAGRSAATSLGTFLPQQPTKLPA